MVEKYLEALNFKGAIENLEDIEKLMKAHVASFAFSSMAVVLKETISLELDAIYEKVVVQRRGAYCFEHNKLFYELLKALGFEVKFYIARVVNNKKVEAPLTHRFTLLHHENERYLVDVGFGYFCPTKPIKFEEEETTAQLDYVYRVHRFEERTYALQMIHSQKWYTFYKFDLNPCYEVDFEVANFYSHKHPKAIFVNNLVVSRVTFECIYSLRNSGYQKIYKEKTENIVIENLEQFSTILAEELNCCFEPHEQRIVYETFINKGINR